MKKINFVFLLFSLLFLFNLNNSQAAYLKFVPQTIYQPDGTKIECFASGDEFYNWLHDQDGYTIIQSQEDGYYYYADLKNGLVVPGEYKVNEIAPENIPGLKKWIKASEKYYKERVKSFRLDEKDIMDAPTSGVVNNISVYIRFSDEDQFMHNRGYYETRFNGYDTVSLRDYYDEVSYEVLEVNTHQYPECEMDENLSYQDDQPRAYYQPYNSVSNPVGYANDEERTQREHMLLKNAVEFVEEQIPDTLTIDANDDGFVDNVSFIIYGSPGAWASLLWPHRWVLYSYDVQINGKQVYDYLFMLEDGFNVGTLCHEFFHCLGAPDLYHYSYEGPTPVGGWDLMESNANPPQYMGAYMKWKYGDWLDAIPVLNSPGTYTLNPLQQNEDVVYRINSPNTTAEYFVVEYRKKEGRYENSTPGNGSGMLVYRINTTCGDGNADGPPDEVYLYRPGGTLEVTGNLASAPFNEDYGRTEISDATDPYPFLSNGSNGGLHLFNIGSAQETISFELDFEEAEFADLIVADVLLSPQHVVEGDYFTVSFNTTNIGGGFATDTYCRYYLSSDTLLSDNDNILSGISPVESLDAGESFFIEKELRIPNSGDTGDKYVLIASDYYSDVNESNEQNNVGYAAIRVLSNDLLPDLALESVTGDDRVPRGQIAFVTGTIINNGEEASAPNQVKIFLSEDDSHDDGDIFLDSLPFDLIEATESMVFSDSVLIPLETEKGDYFMLLVVDADLLIEETDENNNVFALPLHVEYGVSVMNPETVNEVAVFPNPNDGVFIVSGNNIREIEILDLTGKLLYKSKQQNQNEKIYHLDLQEVAGGVYIIKIISDHNISLKRIIIK